MRFTLQELSLDFEYTEGSSLQSEQCYPIPVFRCCLYSIRAVIFLGISYLNDFALPPTPAKVEDMIKYYIIIPKKTGIP